MCVYLANLDDPVSVPATILVKEALESVREAVMALNLSEGKGSKWQVPSSLSLSQIAMLMEAQHRFVLLRLSDNNDSSTWPLAYYVESGPNEGIYVSNAESIMVLAQKYEPDLTDKQGYDIIGILRRRAMMVGATVFKSMDPDLIAMNNGIFNYKTKQLSLFDPDIVFLSKSAIDYVPGAQPVHIPMPDGGTWDFDSWLLDLASGDEEVCQLLWQGFSAAMRPNIRWKMLAPYNTKGNNGKGTYLSVIKSLLGRSAWCSIPIASFDKDSLLVQLMWAQAVLVDENDVGTFANKLGNWKSVVNRDSISFDRKYLTPISLTWWGFQCQCFNEFPKTSDKSDSFYRRLLFIPMLQEFEGRENKAIKDDYLKREDVLQYVAWRALHSDFYEFIEPQAVKDCMMEYKIANDSIRAFWDTFHDRFVWDLLPFSFLYDLYVAWFKRSNAGGHPYGLDSFRDGLVNIMAEDPAWECPDPRKKYRTGPRMVGPERLIAEYELEFWRDKSYPGKDPDRISQPLLRATERGLTRRVSAAGQRVPGDEEDTPVGT